MIDQELQWRDALAMDPNDAAMLRQYFYHLMSAGMLNEGLDVMQRAYETEPLLAMISAQYAQALSKFGRCDEAMQLAIEAEELGGSSRAVTEVECSIRAGDAEMLTAAISKMVELSGSTGPSDVLGLPMSDMSRALVDSAHPARPQIARGLHKIWTENPSFQSNDHVYWVIDVATYIGEFDLVFDMLESVIDECGLMCYTVAWSPLFSVGDSSSRLRSHSRFVEVLSKTELPEYWREFGWPNGCEPAGDTFRCF
jgi:hypothetical protein